MIFHSHLLYNCTVYPKYVRENVFFGPNYWRTFDRNRHIRIERVFLLKQKMRQKINYQISTD